MQRYFIAASQITDETVVLTGDDAHHALRVMRMKPGDSFICSDGHERIVLAQVAELDKDTLTARIIENLQNTVEPKVEVWIAQSLPKGDKMEVVIQKGTEVGATRFIPFTSSRGIVKYDESKESRKLARWRKIAKEAAEQAHRNQIPDVEAVCGWEDVLHRVGEVDLAFICYEKEGTFTFRQQLLQLRSRPRSQHRQSEHDHPTILLMVGPEGGFTEGEVVEAEQLGWNTISLGNRILRTETAALVGLTCILYEFGEMGV